MATAEARLRILERRAAHLERRVAAAATSSKDLTFDKAEASAIRWAVEKLRQHLGQSDPERQ